jgi:hypothetical protein
VPHYKKKQIENNFLSNFKSYNRRKLLFTVVSIVLLSYSFIYPFNTYINKEKSLSAQEVEKKVVLKEKQKVSKNTWSVNTYPPLHSFGVLNNKKDIPEQIAATFGAGTLVIPMDNTYQPGSTDGIELKAYGLVVRLLHADIPVKRAIKNGKSSKNQVDFTAWTKKAYTANDNVANRSFRYGPYIIVTHLNKKLKRGKNRIYISFFYRLTALI